MKLFKDIVLSVVFISILVVIFIFNQNDNSFQQIKVSAGAEHNLSGYAWSDNIGWISFNCSDAETCSTVDYGVNIESNNELSGYAWSDNIGWVSFTESDLNGCPESDCKAKLVGGSLEGWAKALSADGDGWDGWISLSTQPSGTISHGVSLVGINFEGYAWGSDVIGWVSFDDVVYGDYGDPVIDTFSVENVINGNTPTISWETTNADNCEGSWTEDNLCTGIDCASGSVEGPAIFVGTTYIITCSNISGAEDSLSETPSLYYNLKFIDGYSSDVDVDFVVSGATTTKTMIGVTPWNGFGASVTLDVDLSAATPDALPNDSYPIYSDRTLTSSEYNDGSEFSIYISKLITRSQTVLVTGSGNMLNGVNVVIKGDGITPIWIEI
ncbi:MAG: hypothetical protein KAS02_01860 [Candidatus Pacebacteria bacterium]|nr:hypothetical protein [Candidatus Paceibacterota bacterium]